MWRPLATLVIGLALALGFDQSVRWLTPEPPTENSYWYLQTVQYHPVLGWSGYPHLVTTKDGIPVQTNALGYRDREPSQENDSRTLGVLFLGDSFTWGDEVRQDERFSSLVEASCGSACDRLPAVRAINKGIIGYGTTQSFLDYLLTRDKRQFQVVVLALFTGNDLSDNVVVDSHSGPRPRFRRCHQPGASLDLCLEGVPVPPVIDWPEHRVIDPRSDFYRRFDWSGLVTLASRRRAPRFLIDRRIASQMDGLNVLPFPIVARTSDAPIEDRVGQMEAILRALARTIRADGKAFGVLLFPSARLYSGDGNGELEDYRATVDVLNRLAIPFADFFEHTRGARWQDLYSGPDGHWRPAGHQEAATLLRSLLVTIRDELRSRTPPT